MLNEAVLRDRYLVSFTAGDNCIVFIGMVRARLFSRLTFCANASSIFHLNFIYDDAVRAGRR